MGVASDLRKGIAKRKGPKDGTVVRFKREKDGVNLRTLEPTGERITLDYVAVFISATGLWYLTGTTGLGTKAFTHEGFLTLLAEPDMHSVAVVTDWEEVS